MAPELPIEVDAETGVWTTDALPMLYVPRHFFINNHVAVEEALGVETYATFSITPATRAPGTGARRKRSCMV